MNVHPKVGAATVAGAGSIVIVFALGSLGVSVPPEVASAISTILAFAAGYLKSS
jgi:hypothetical protein